MTNSELAAKIGVDRTLASRLRNGKRSPSKEVIWRIARAFDFPTADIVDATHRGPEAFGKWFSSKLPGEAERQTTLGR